jgi:hypothetical protein
MPLPRWQMENEMQHLWYNPPVGDFCDAAQKGPLSGKR